MVTNDTQPIAANMRAKNSVFFLTDSRSGSANTCSERKKRKIKLFDPSKMSPYDECDERTVMILEKMMAKAGCIAPLIVAQKVPTKMYGHSGRFSRSTLKNDASGISSSCRGPGHRTELGQLASDWN